MDPKRYLGERLIKRSQDDCAPFTITLWSNRLARIHQRYRQNRQQICQRSRSIGRTVTCNDRPKTPESRQRKWGVVGVKNLPFPCPSAALSFPARFRQSSLRCTALLPKLHSSWYNNTNLQFNTSQDHNINITQNSNFPIAGSVYLTQRTAFFHIRILSYRIVSALWAQASCLYAHVIE